MHRRRAHAFATHLGDDALLPSPEFIQLFRTLSHRARRRILVAVKSRSPSAGNEFELAEVLPADEALKIRCHHQRLPRLGEAGFIDWDRENDTIAKGPSFEEVEPVLDRMADNQDALPGVWP